MLKRIARRQDEAVEIFPKQPTIDVLLHRPNFKVSRKLKAWKKRNPDLLSELPDEILLKIVELVPLKEAGRTSVLSKRWRHTWAYLTLLNFDPGNIKDELWVDSNTFDKEKFLLEKSRYLSWVDGVISSHKAPTIQDFSLRFALEHENRGNIDAWIKFAVEKRVKRLKLNFQNYDGSGIKFPYNLPTFLSFCNSLASLKLAYVNVTGQALERIIYCCPALEYLSVTHSDLLIDLNIAGPSLNLKFLKIAYCLKLNILNISAPNLKSFYHFGAKLDCPLTSTPKIAELCIDVPLGKYVTDVFSVYSSCISQVEILTLYLPFYNDAVQVFPMCTKLKMLHLSVPAACGDNLFCFSSLIKACPFLERFVLQLSFIAGLHHGRREKAGQREACPHGHLKIVKILGFFGGEVDTGFVKYLLNIAISLEKIILDTRKPPQDSIFRDRKTLRKASDAANKLREYARSGTKLVIR